MRPITYVGGDATRPGGDWAVIAAIIEEEVCARPIAVTVYDPPAR